MESMPAYTLTPMPTLPFIIGVGTTAMSVTIMSFHPNHKNITRRTRANRIRKPQSTITINIIIVITKTRAIDGILISSTLMRRIISKNNCKISYTKHLKANITFFTVIIIKRAKLNKMQMV